MKKNAPKFAHDFCFEASEFYRKSFKTDLCVLEIRIKKMSEVRGENHRICVRITLKSYFKNLRNRFHFREKNDRKRGVNQLSKTRKKLKNNRENRDKNTLKK